MCNKELDDTLSDDFLDGLDDDSTETEEVQEAERVKPDWVSSDEEHNSYKAWSAILELVIQKEDGIKAYKKIADKSTPVGLYQVKKSEVGKRVGAAPQNLFNGKQKFCKGLRTFFKVQNKDLYKLFEKEQAVLRNPQTTTGLRAKKKALIVNEYQELREAVKLLRRKNAKEVIDLAISRMPLDLQDRLRSR